MPWRIERFRLQQQKLHTFQLNGDVGPMAPRPNVKGTSLVELAELVGASTSHDLSVTGISHNSSEVVPGDLYVALPGANHHGIEFLSEAVANGARAVATDAAGLAAAHDFDIPVIELANARRQMATLAREIYGRPDSKLSIVGVTGTNGKTTTTHMLRTIFAETGHSVGVIGTLGTYLNDDHIPGARTTPESTDLYALFALMVQRGVTHVFMEVSSHALVLDRVAEVSFDAAVFTNLTQDHLDFHGSMENYFQAKASLFRAGVARHAVICIDDEWGVRLSTSLSIPTLTVGKQGSWKIGTTETTQYGLTKCAVSTPKGNLNLVLNMFGSFNVTNATLAIATADLLGVDSSNAALALGKLAAIPGRFEIVKHSAAGTAVVDYAHTPDAVATVLNVIKESNPSKIITVIGCGGDRDASKRPLMGEAAAKLSDLVIVTDDNPRSEIPADIRSAVVGGTVGGKAEVVEIADRREAIRFALSQASDGDVIAVLGKGHESGQEINGEILPFDDREVIVAEASRV